jgi:hypothetical protein
MKYNRYNINKKLLLLYFAVLVVVICLLLRSLEFKKYMKGEFESFQRYNRSISSTLGFYQDGSMKNFSDQTPDELIETVGRVGSVLFNGYETPSGVGQKIELFIKFKNLNKIFKDREQAIALGVNKQPKEVPCKISYGEKTFSCKVKLKGDLEDHWEYKTRLSLKVAVSEGSINGLKRFSIQKPRARQFPYDQIFHRLAAQMGSHSSNMQEFYSVSVNGEDWGTMNVEPDIDQQYTEALNLKRLGVYRISNQDVWAYGEKYKGLSGYYISDPTVNLSFKGSDKVLKTNAAHLEIYSVIKRRLRSKDAKLFNREMMVDNLALSLVWGALHTLYSANSFYTWNVYKGQLEPILTDQVFWSQWENTEKLFTNLNEIPFEYRILFNNNSLKTRELNEAIVRIHEIIALNPPVKIAQALQKKYFPNDHLITEAPLTKNISLIEENLNALVVHINRLAKTDYNEHSTRKTVRDMIPSLEAFHSVEAYADGRIRVNNLLNLNLKITDIRLGSKRYLQTESIIIPPSKSEHISYYDLDTSVRGNDLLKLKVRGEIDGEVRYASPELVMTASSENVPHDKNKGCKFINGHCVLAPKFTTSNTVLFDKPVLIEAGSTITLKEGANLLFLAGVTAKGEPHNKIEVYGDRTGGIYILNSSTGRSEISQAIFVELGAVQAPMYNLTGSVNGYGGSFFLDEVHFIGCEAEDQLNIVHAEVLFGNVSFKTAKSDAFDCDFCTGDIQRLSFDNVGGDGFDISGSNISLKHMTATNVRDKALSVGERSSIFVENIHVDRVSTGVAVKDASSAIVKSMNAGKVFDDALMTYIKKDMYKGTTKLKLGKYHSTEPAGGNLCVREKGTELNINDSHCDISVISVAELYQGRMKK